MIEISEIEKITVESYIETLRIIEVGKTHYFSLVGTVYAGFHNAKTRLAKKNIKFLFRTFQEDGVHYIEIKRTK